MYRVQVIKAGQVLVQTDEKSLPVNVKTLGSPKFVDCRGFKQDNRPMFDGEIDGVHVSPLNEHDTLVQIILE